MLRRLLVVMLLAVPLYAQELPDAPKPKLSLGSFEGSRKKEFKYSCPTKKTNLRTIGFDSERSYYFRTQSR
jgi:hypothetical protein